MTELTNDHGSQLDRVTETLRELDGAVESLILNETAVLEGLSQMLNAVHQMHTRSDENQRKQSEQIHQFGLLIASHVRNRRSQSPIIVAESEFNLANPETGLLQHLYSYLPHTTAIDVGAHVGEMTERLLASGYSVTAFEPFPASFQQIERKKKSGINLQVFPWAVGREDCTMSLYIASEVSARQKSDASLFHSLVPHTGNEQLEFRESIPVTVRSLESLVKSGEIPDPVGLLKIDAEGFDLDVLRGIGRLRPSVVMAEFWDAQHEFGKSGRGVLGDLVTEMKRLGYAWHLVIYHNDAQSVISYYHNRQDSIPGSWGNVIFFQEQRLLAEALRWVEAVLPPTLFR